MRKIRITSLSSNNENNDKCLLNSQLVEPFDIVSLEQYINHLVSSRLALLLNKTEDIQIQPGISAKDYRLLQKLDKLMEKNYHDPQLSVKTLSTSVAMVERQLRRKLKELINQGPSEYIRTFKLNKAIKKMLDGESLHLAAENAGFACYSTFSTNFKAKYDMSPSKYQAKILNNT